MSHTIVKSVSIVHKTEDNTFHLKICGATNNIFPRHYSTWVSPVPYKSSEEAACGILGAYLNGDFHGGVNRYARFVKAFDAGLVAQDLKAKLDALRVINNKNYDRFDRMPSDRVCKVASRLYQFMLDIKYGRAMLAAFTAWKPDAKKYHVIVGGKYVFSSRKGRYNMNLKLTTCAEDAKEFDEVTAKDIERHFAKYGVRLIAA